MVLCLLHYYAVPIGKEHARQSRRGTHRDYTLAIGYLEPTTHFVPIQATREQEEAPAAAKRSGIRCSSPWNPCWPPNKQRQTADEDLRSIPTRSSPPSVTAIQSLYCLTRNRKQLGAAVRSVAQHSVLSPAQNKTEAGGASSK